MGGISQYKRLVLLKALKTDREIGREKKRGGTTRGTSLFIVTGETRMFTVLEVLRQYPLFFQGKAGWKQSRTLGNEEGSVMGSGLLEVCSDSLEYLKIHFVPRSKHPLLGCKSLSHTTA
jgi:hypothetical protein